MKGVSGELNDGHEKITEHQAGDMMSLAAPMQNVMRGWQQPTGGQRGCQEHHANDEAHGVQGEPDVGRLHYRSEKFSKQNDLFLIVCLIFFFQSIDYKFELKTSMVDNDDCTLDFEK